MNVFISHSRSEVALARTLAKALEANGVAVSLDTASCPPGELLSDAIERSVADADSILLLVGAESEPSLSQQAVLKAAWTSPTKRLIPLLIGNARLPNFVRSAVRSGDTIQAIRIRDPRRDWQKVVGELVDVLLHRADLKKFAQNLNTTAEDRAQQKERLAYLRRAAETFKP